MNRRHFLQGLAGVTLCPLCPPRGFAAEGAHWGYEGTHGPDRWGEVNAASRVCAAGIQQSPIDIGEAIRAQMPPLTFSWRRRADTLVNNGHTIEVNFTDGSKLDVGKQRYSLLQFHFHRPSEHLIGGKNFPMETHFVHRNDAGALAVVGVLMIAGKASKAFSAVTASMPAHPGPAIKAAPGIDPNGLLPPRRTYYRYSGSLTTPPCAEIVEWFPLTDPVQVAAADIAAFAKLYPMNARPAQKANRRFVLRSL